MRTLILGAGGVGGYLAARMAEVGIPPTLLLRDGTADAVERDGLHLSSPLGDWHGMVPVLRVEGAPHARREGWDEHGDASDLVILACKAPDLASALDAVRPHVRPGTAVLPFLNGTAHIEAIEAALPFACVLGGVAHIGATTQAPGRILHLNRLCTFLVGPLRNGAAVPDTVWSLFSRLKSGTLDARTVPDASDALWTKLVFLATLAAVTTLHRADVGTVLAVPGGRDMILEALEEARTVAAAEGFESPESDLAQYRTQLTEEGSTATASMLRDLRAGRPTEAEHVLGDLVVRARRHELDTPHLDAALRAMRTYEHLRTNDGIDT